MAGDESAAQLEMGALAAAPFLVLLPATGQDRPIRAVGEFSNVRYTEEHAYGYAVELWRDGDSAIGLLLVSAGLQGDTPTGLMENVKFNARTGALSFTAKLSTGVVLSSGGGQEPSRDLFEFSGRLSAGVLKGTMRRSGARERVALRLQRRAAWITAASYGEWKRQVDEILKVRGPKW